MTTRTITRIAAIAATIGIAGLPLTLSSPASAINKHESGGKVSAGPVPSPQHQDGDLDLVQIGAGTVGGIAVTGAAFAATARLRGHKPFSTSPSVKTPIVR
ncbi:hypothetical protein BWI15_05660 [Kribbella sp. ALI-6-A]|uniref:hypothetical protein n=1 Tax=Kribbella sp. ALI-6-A TaxID=1933817 RepID=UPI00097C71BC|nr:hypothetical protein [Kribbella sp. ALI-6-A]ONI76769.1 hypothetical protein BWI15_05660 [Kribbella sp. ALI-6-A]